MTRSLRPCQPTKVHCPPRNGHKTPHDPDGSIALRRGAPAEMARHTSESLLVVTVACGSGRDRYLWNRGHEFCDVDYGRLSYVRLDRVGGVSYAYALVAGRDKGLVMCGDDDGGTSRGLFQEESGDEISVLQVK